MIFLLLISNLFAQEGSVSIQKYNEEKGILQDSWEMQAPKKRTKYYDGCNYHTCDDEGNCTSTLLYCPPPKSDWEPPKHWKKVMEY